MNVAGKVLLEGKKVEHFAHELLHVAFKIFVQFGDNMLHKTNS